MLAPGENCATATETAELSTQNVVQNEEYHRSDQQAQQQTFLYTSEVLKETRRVWCSHCHFDITNNDESISTTFDEHNTAILPRSWKRIQYRVRLFLTD
jgi:hypothetical protein